MESNKVSATYIDAFLNNPEEGFLIKYHFNEGIDKQMLDELYGILELLKGKWADETLIEKHIVFLLYSIVPTLYMDLPNYLDNKDKYDEYVDIIYNLDSAIAMCVNPDKNDPHFNTPLKELGTF